MNNFKLMFFKDILFCTDKIRVDYFGNIIKDRVIINKNDITKVDKDNDLVIDIELGYFKQTIKLSLLVYLAFHNPLLRITDLENIVIMFKDNDNRNLNSDNLVPKFINGGIIDLDYPEYRVIPGFSRYAITNNGVIRDRFSGLHRRSYVNKKGYKFISLVNDWYLSKSTLVHRLVGLTWLDFPYNFNILTINHKDGVKLNNYYKNLEWCTFRENAHHAKLTGLDPLKMVKVIVKNITTDEEIKFICIADCAKYFNIAHSTVVKKLNGLNNVKEGYIFKYDDGTPFGKPKKTISKFKRQVIVTNVQMEDTIIFDTITSCADKFNLNTKSIAYRCLFPNRIYDEYTFKYN